MVLIIKLNFQDFQNYREEFRKCLLFNNDNNYIKKILVFTELNIGGLPKFPKVKYFVRRDSNIKTTIDFAKKFTKEKMYLYSSFLYIFTERELKQSSLQNQVVKSDKWTLFFDNTDFELINLNPRPDSTLVKQNLELSTEIETTKNIIRKKGDLVQTTTIIDNSNELNVVIVSVNYNDFLLVSLSNNRKIFENITIVTSPDDLMCQKICEKFGVNCIITDRMYENGAKFNKGKAINEAVKRIEKGWILLLDADIVVDKKLNVENLDKSSLYTSDRYHCEDYSRFSRYKEGFSEIDSVGYFEMDRGLGFFQLYHKSKGFDFPESSDDAAWSDLMFRDKFTSRRKIENRVIHLGKAYSNWEGRKTGRFLTDEEFHKIYEQVEILKNYFLKKSKRLKEKSEKLAIITTFFNPNKYTNIKFNYLKFEKQISEFEGCELFPIELTFDDDFFINHRNVIQIAGDENNILWQKERLMNIALEKVPEDFINIAWVDCDIIFNNKNWHREVSEKLQNYKVLQLYEKAKRLDRNDEVSLISQGLVSRINEINEIDLNLSKGIPGFGWAIRREVIEKIGFLDIQIIGGADSLMLYSFFGKPKGFVSEQMNSRWYDEYKNWSDKCYEIIDSSVNFVSGTITHLYHGENLKRQYNTRYEILRKLSFDPAKDLKRDHNNLWTIKNKKIINGLKIYFEQRDEDDNVIKINEYFDKVFVLNLDRKKERMRKANKKLKSLNIDYTRFSAIDGNILNFESNFEQGKGLIENKFALGCLMSHLAIIKESKEKGYKRILILEDDVLISKDINILIQSIRNKNWKLLYLGGSQYDWNVEFTDDFYYSKKTLGTFAYAIDSTLYDEIIEKLQSPTKSVDNILSEIQEQNYGKCFTFYPNICIADVSESEIREGRDNIQHSVKMRWNLLKNYI